MSATLKSKLAEGRVVRLFCLGQLCSPKLTELLGCVGGFDGVWLDQEHVGLTTPQIEEAARAARAVGLDTFVRLTATDYATVMRALEAGAGGVMAAMVRSAKEAEQLAYWARFHPEGGRGVNGTGADGRFGTLRGPEYFRQSNERILVGVQIEHADAVEAIDAIASVAGIDFLFVGPADLSQSLGIPFEWENPRLWSAIERVAAACKRNGRRWGILPMSPAHAKRSVQLGCTMLSIGLDVWAFRDGMRAALEAYKEV
jgi:4-hydroxy-2-oxoheptanedioate aldolase